MPIPRQVTDFIARHTLINNAMTYGSEWYFDAEVIDNVAHVVYYEWKLLSPIFSAFREVDRLTIYGVSDAEQFIEAATVVFNNLQRVADGL